jgi:hypothetical protein
MSIIYLMTGAVNVATLAFVIDNPRGLVRSLTSGLVVDEAILVSNHMRAVVIY